MSTQFEFNVALKSIQQEGTLAWEYNPFRNYRLDENMIYYKDVYYPIYDFFNKYFGIDNPNIDSIQSNDNGYEVTFKDGSASTTISLSNWNKVFCGEKPIVYQKGQLVDLITEDFDFDLNHPVQITPVYSYDNSVDLIINDGKSAPKLINSRFSAVGKNRYQIVDRSGDNDTNIYDRGQQFDIDTSLYKITSLIPEIEFGGESFGGNLPVGNYHFYFKYSDLDGNESDFVAQSGLVSIFIGNTVNSINTGFRNQNSNKKVRFIISNIDDSYDYIQVYYSRATSEEFQNRVTEYKKILQNYKVSQGNFTIVDITGFEDTEDLTFTDINQRLQIYNSAKTQEITHNMLFLGNVTESCENHDYLSKLALYIVPQLNIDKQCEVDQLSSSYQGNITNTYYNPEFLYKYTGYWDDEIYRFGVVFIRNNNTFTPVYNVRGLHLGNTLENVDSSKLKINKDNLISYNETTYEIDQSFIVSSEYRPDLENAKGVCYIPHQTSLTTIVGIDFQCNSSLIECLKKIGIKGYFIVRQKRIPTTLCQAYTIGLETQSRTPMLPYEEEGKYIYESFLNKEEETYYYFNDDGRKETDTGNLLSNIFQNHYREAPKGSVYPNAAICPDYDVNSPYLNQLFTGGQFTVTTQYSNEFLNKTSLTRLYEVNATQCNSSPTYSNIKIIGVEDNVKLVGIDDILYSARAGEAEEAFRFEYVGTEIKKDHGGANLLRGSYGYYLGLKGYKSAGDLITIKIPGYNLGNLLDYFKIRYNDAAAFYPISDRTAFNTSYEDNQIISLGICYRGDCYISKFTHRLNRNFQDPSTPTNDVIVDPTCWTKNMVFEDEVMKKDDLVNINLGDVNAVNLGMWASFILRSNINHSVRSLDQSQVDESLLIGNCRGFYPYFPISAKAAYKLQESNTYNKGFEASVGEQVFEELPNAPFYKNIFSTRIAYSNIQISSGFKNAYRVFVSKNYEDYPITYGEITKLVEWNGNLICILEHGIYEIPVNERTLAGEGSGGLVYVNTSKVLPKTPRVISPTFGSQWIDSICKTSTGIYGVDTVAKKIWKVDSNGIEIISDLRIQEFLNNNITFTERELTPILGIRNVKTHYNSFKHDIMFTFYDDLKGLNEVAWNICWNETMNKWITFYSWIPSISENIYNQYFSFDRETSKYISKISNNISSDYIYLDNTVMNPSHPRIGYLHYDLIYDGTDVEISYKWEILPDVWGNYKKFMIPPNSSQLHYTSKYSDYVNSIDDITEITLDEKTYKYDSGWIDSSGNLVEDSVVLSNIKKERMRLWKQSFDQNLELKQDFKKQRIYMLNIRVTPTIKYKGTSASFADAVSNQNSNILLMGNIERTIAVIPKDHLDSLSTDFWKHGQSGIIDIKDDIKPTLWYGKQHPFELEFVIRDSADAHKIFDNLIIISNKAEPDSFHYEISGQCYDFAKDKETIYIRQEATKEFFQNNGWNITYDENYRDLTETHKKIDNEDIYAKSTIFPAYYFRQDTLNTVEDYYHNRPNEEGKNFVNLSGTELVRYNNLNEFRIWTHSKGVSIENDNRLRGNMHYKEDKWYIQIPSINYIQKNEDSWEKVVKGAGNKDKVPIEILQSNFVNADDVKTSNGLKPIKPLDERGLVLWEDDKIRRQEAKLKDKYIKIRVRYEGKELAIIQAIKTIYSISYS